MSRVPSHIMSVAIDVGLAGVVMPPFPVLKGYLAVNCYETHDTGPS